MVSSVAIPKLSLCVRGATVPHVCLLLYCERDRIQWVWTITDEWLGSEIDARVTVYATPISAREKWSGVNWYFPKYFCMMRLVDIYHIIVALVVRQSINFIEIFQFKVTKQPKWSKRIDEILLKWEIHSFKIIHNTGMTGLDDYEIYALYMDVCGLVCAINHSWVKPIWFRPWRNLPTWHINWDSPVTNWVSHDRE